MIAATFAITVLCSLMALKARPGTAFGLIIMVMMIWPEYLRIPIGLSNMSAPRMVAIVLLIRLIMQGRNKRLKLIWVDKLVILGWMWNILANIAANAEFSLVTQMIGRGFDTVLMYFVARLAILSSEDVKDAFLPIAGTAVYMCLLGVVEAVLYYEPYYSFTKSHSGGLGTGKGAQYRLGLARARGTTVVAIYFGMAMMLITGILWSIRGYVRNRKHSLGAAFSSFIAALTSMSSGPWLACLLLIVCNGYRKRISWIKPTLIGFLIAMIFMELLSNRHFYNLIDYLALSKHNAWYRTRLMEIAVEHWRDFWLIGVGSEWPHHWAEKLDGRRHIDIVNHFIITGLYGGVLGMGMYIATHVMAIRLAIAAWRRSVDARQRDLLFGLAATLIAFDAASMSVGIFGPALLLSYLMLGMTVSISVAWRKEAPTKPNPKKLTRVEKPKQKINRSNR